MEDGGALGYLFRDIDDPSAVEKRLQLFERVRKSRVSRIQILSTVRANREKEVEEEVKKYADPPGSGRSHATRKSLNQSSLRAQLSQLRTKNEPIMIMCMMFSPNVKKCFDNHKWERLWLIELLRSQLHPQKIWKVERIPNC